MFGTDSALYRPVQLYHLGQSGLTCRLMQPDESLVSCIYYYWLLEIQDQAVQLPIVPDGAVDLVVSPHFDDFAALYSPKPDKFVLSLTGPVIYAGICFRADRAGGFFSRTLSELDRLEAGVAVTTSLGLKPLVTGIHGITDAKTIAELFDGFFIHYEARPKIPDQDQRYANLFDRLDISEVRTMAEQAGLSERQFRRVTSNLFGLRPKQIHRITRLQSLLRELLESDPGLLTDEFYDDSHRIKELKQLTGLTPGEIRRMAENYNHRKH